MIRALPQDVGPGDVTPWLRQSLRINQQLVRELTKLPKTEDGREDIQALLREGARMNEAMEDFIAAGSTADLEALLRAQTELSAAGKEFDRIALGFGASTCAEGSSVPPGTSG